MSAVTVHTQEELDAALAAHAKTIDVNSPAGVVVTIRDTTNSTVELYGSSRASLYGSSRASLYDSSSAWLYDSSHASLYDSSHAWLYDSSRAWLYDSSARLYVALTHKRYATEFVKVGIDVRVDEMITHVEVDRFDRFAEAVTLS